MNIDQLPVILGGIGLLVAFIIYRVIMTYSAGSGKVVEIGEEIHKGAMTFIRREYTILFIFAAIVGAAVFFSLGYRTAIAFAIGALCSSAAGFIGMHTATKANVRTTTAASEKGPGAALNVAFFGGSIMGLTVAAMGLLGLRRTVLNVWT